MKKARNEKGITIVSLVITIIIMLILSGVVLTGIAQDNGIIKNSKKAKEQTEIGNEVEQIEQATVKAMAKNASGKITEEGLKEGLAENLGKVNIYDDDEVFIIEIAKSKRYYTVDSNGKVEKTDETAIITDENPGVLDGKGTQTEPYRIMSIEDLVYLSKSVSEGKSYRNYYLELGRNLNFNSKMSYGNYNTKEYNEYLGVTDDVGLKEALTNRKYKGFIPIGSGKKAFSGSFGGKCYSIKNLYENTDVYGGLFCEVMSGNISDLTIVGKIVSSANYTGGIVGKANNNTNIKNCISHININSTGNQVGGIVGVFGIIEDCKNYGNIIGANEIGGISGNGSKTINSKNYGSIKGENHIGGISGRYGKVTECENYGEITGNEIIGGIIGQMNINNINKVINYGKITGSEMVGGICGDNVSASFIVNVVNKGDVIGKTKVGGILGYGTSIKPIINCYNLGKVEGTSRIGGIVGYCAFTQNDTSKIINCYNIGEVIGTNTNKTGAVLGEKYGYGTHYIENCYWEEKNGLAGYNETKSANGNFTVTDSKSYSRGFIEGKETGEKSFLEILNEYVEKYNTENAEETDFVELNKWKKDEEKGYPILN